MGRKSRGKRPRKADDVDQEDGHVGVAVESLDADDPMFKDEIANFHQEREKLMLDPADDDKDDGAAGFDEITIDPADLESSEEDEDDEDEEDDSDDDEESGAGEKAWGTKTSAFYGTNYVDDGLGSGSEDEDAEAAEVEEALVLKQQMHTLLTKEAFGLGDSVDVAQDAPEPEAPIKAKMSDEQWMEFVEKNHPEVVVMKDLIKTKTQEADETEVLMKKARLLPPTHNNKELLRWLEGKFQLWLMAVQHAMFYLHIRCKRSAGPEVRHHPVVNYIFKDQKVMDKWSGYGVQLRPMLAALENDGDMEEAVMEMSRRAKKERGLNSQRSERAKKEKAKKSQQQQQQKKQAKKTKKSLSFGLPDQAEEDSDMDDDDDSGIPLCPVEDMMDEKEAQEGSEKRAITYEMAKNKGLTPHRSKEVRNPRVKMRKKFRKAQIRRKGQVRQVIQQAGAYGGELTGIRRNVVKSVHFK